MKGLVIAFVAVVVLGGYGCMAHNGNVASDESVKASWGQVENVYQRRMDLVPNLVNTVKGAADFERSTLEAVTEARASATQAKIDVGDLTDPDKLAKFEEAQKGLSGALGKLMMITENYPQLRATEAFRDLQAQLEGTENRIAVERGRYNLVVQSHNTRVRQFPNSLIASMDGTKVYPTFKAQSGAEKAPEVHF